MLAPKSKGQSLGLIGLSWTVWFGLAIAQSGNVAPDTVSDCTLFMEYPDPFLPEQGTTCASIAEYWAITESAFIIWNPSVRSDCSNLVEGNSYCVEENFSSEPSNPSPSSSVTSRTSTVTSSQMSSPPSGTTSSIPTRSSNSATTTSSSGPSPTQSGLASDCRDFYFVESGDTCTAIVDSYRTFTLTQFYAWNPAVGNSCQGLQAGFWVCVGVPGTPTSRPASTVTSTQAPTATPNGPQPQPPNVRKDCQRFHQVVSGDTCEVIVNRYRTFTSQQFISWNPDVGSACTGLWLDYHVCIGVPGTPTVAPSSSAVSSSTGVVTPTPIQSGVISTCNRFSLSGPSGGTCNGYSRNRGMSLAQLYAWNRGLGVRGENCASTFRNNMNYCIGVSGPLPPPNNGPVQPGVTSICWRYGQATSGGTCAQFAQRFGISVGQLAAWNPALGTNGQNCHNNFWAGYYYCVQIAG